MYRLPKYSLKFTANI
jgi:hypothetical protein